MEGSAETTTCSNEEDEPSEEGKEEGRGETERTIELFEGSWKLSGKLIPYEPVGREREEGGGEWEGIGR